MKIVIIAAIDQNNALGKDNKLLWKLSADLKMFKELTTSNIIIMGRKTFDSIGKPLPNRVNMVITRNKYFYEEGVTSVDSLRKAIELSREYGKDVFIIGGGEIYSQAIAVADEMVITYVNCKKDADTFFPEIDANYWKEASRQVHQKDEKNEYDFDVVVYKKK